MCNLRALNERAIRVMNSADLMINKLMSEFLNANFALVIKFLAIKNKIEINKMMPRMPNSSPICMYQLSGSRPMPFLSIRLDAGPARPRPRPSGY